MAMWLRGVFIGFFGIFEFRLFLGGEIYWRMMFFCVFRSFFREFCFLLNLVNIYGAFFYRKEMINGDYNFVVIGDCF